MKTKEEILKSYQGPTIATLEILLDIRDCLAGIEKWLQEIEGQVEDLGDEARMNIRIQNQKEA